MADILTVTTGKVDCRLAVTTNDQNAPNPLFDTIAPSGYVYLRPRKSAYVTNDPGVIVIPDEISLVVDSEGWAVMPDPSGGPSLARTIDLPAVDGMTWRVSFDLRIPAYSWQTGVVENRLRVDSFDIPVEAGKTTHIADYLPAGVDPSTGAVWVKGDKGDPNPGIRDMLQVDGELLVELEDGRTVGPFDLPPSTVPGPASELSIGTVTTGAEGSAASATVTGAAPNFTLNLTLPRGASGSGGGLPSGGTTNQVPIRAADGGTAWASAASLVPAATTSAAGLLSAADKARLDASVDSAFVSTQTDQVVADTSHGTIDAVQRLKVGAVWNMREADPAFWLQGASINESTSEIYAVYQLNTSPNNVCAIEIRDLATGALKSRKTFSTSNSAFTESASWFMNGADLCFVVRPAAATSDKASKAAIYNYTQGSLAAQFDILGQCKASVANGCYYTTDAWGSLASRVFVYDWASVQAGAPALKRTIYLEDAGPTIEKTQGLEVIQDKIYLLMGAGNGTPAVSVYDHDGLRVGAVLYDKRGFGETLNASRPGTVSNVGTYVYESEGAATYRGMLASVHVINQQGVIVYHGAQGAVKAPLQPLPERNGWVQFTPSDTSWTVPYGVLRYRVLRGVLEISGYATNSTFTGGYTTIFTFPEWARPKQSAAFILGANTTVSMAARVEASGALQMYSSVATAAWRCLDIVRVPLT